MKGKIRVVRGKEVRLTLPVRSVTIEANGTIWCHGMPVLGITDPEIKLAVATAIKAKRYDLIPAEAWIRLGYNDNGAWAGDDESWAAHPLKAEIDTQDKAAAERKAKEVIIYLSSRGWGDYSAVEWIGDITRPDAEILAECKEALTSGHDVDKRNQSDEQILDKIIEARAKWSTPEEPYIQPQHGPGYCYSCETYCYGDCGNYQPRMTLAIQLRQTGDIAREADYGIND